MTKNFRALKLALKLTLPVMLGYVFLGSAYGILMESRGNGLSLTLLMSVFVYAGSMQFAAADFFAGGFSYLSIAVMTLMINIRHVFYGLSMLERYKDAGKKKPYLIFSLTDETYSLLCSIEPPEGIEKNLFYLLISGLNQSYWVTGSLLGTLIGSAGLFNAKGVDFAMTALFIVIMVSQWKEKKNRIPALIGAAGSVLCLLVFGPARFILPSMVVMLLALTLARGKLEKEEGQDA
jgi:4-azaleucine resistance transporter AzlC